MTGQFLMNPAKLILQQRRFLWQYVSQAFNLVDQHRLKIVGPDRMCAEWLLKNSASVIIMVGKTNKVIPVDNYLALPTEDQKIVVSEIDGTSSTIMSIGFDHLRNCNHVRKITLDNCKYLEDEALSKLHHVNKSLEELTVNRLRNVSRAGLFELIESVPNLKRLEIGQDMPLVKDIASLVPQLKTHLPHCEITIK